MSESIRHTLRLAWVGILSWTLAACQGGAGTPTCSLKDPAIFPTCAPAVGATPAVCDTWPKVHGSQANTGNVDTSQSPFTSSAYDVLAATTKSRRWTFPPLDEPAKSPFKASPVINSAGTALYIGSGDGHLYALSPSDGTQISTFKDFAIGQPINEAALVGVRDGQDAIFVSGSDGRLYGLNATGDAQASNWPFFAGSALTTAPNLATDGTVFVGTDSGLFSGVCPNGVIRFGLSVSGATSAAAVGPDSTVYFGADDHRLRALQTDGVLKWSFATAGTIAAAPVVEIQNGVTVAIYAADRSGRLFKVNAKGQAVFTFGAVGPIAASPALAGERLYFGTDDGDQSALYAVDKTTGTLKWSAAIGHAIVAAPAVGISADGNKIIVVGSNDGNVYFFNEATSTNETSPPTRVAFSIASQYAQPDPCQPIAGGDSACAVRSSPAIGRDGTVYVGADDGRVYAIGSDA